MTTAPERADARRRTLAAFGLPEGTPYGRLTLTGNRAGTVDYEAALIHPDGCEEPASKVTGTAQADWPAPYVVTLYGLFAAPPASPTTLPGLTEPVRWLPVHVGDPLTTPPEQGDIGMVLLWATVRYGTSVVYGALWAHPDGTLTDGVKGTHLRHNKVEREWAYQGLPHLRTKVQRATTPLPAEEFLGLCQETAVLLWLGGTREFKPLTIYTARGWGHSRFYQLLAEYRAQGYPWAKSARLFCAQLELHAEREVLRRRRAGIPDIPDR